MEYAIDCINSAVKKLKYQYVKNGCSARGIENDYAIGFINGLRSKFEEQKRANQEWGLVLVKDKEVVEVYSQIKFNKTIITDTWFQGHPEVYEKDIVDGEKFSISDKITEGETEDFFALASGDLDT